MMKQDTDGLLLSGTEGEIFSIQFPTDKKAAQINKKYGVNLPTPVSGVAGKYDTLYVSVEAEGKIYQYPFHSTDVTSSGSVLVEGLDSPTEMNWTRFCPGENLGTTEDPEDTPETGEETSNTTNQCLAEGGEIVDLEYLETYLDISTLMRLQEGEEIIFLDENGNEATASYLEDEVSFKAVCVSLEKPADIVMLGEGCTLSRNMKPQDSSIWILLVWMGIRIISSRSWRMRRE